MDHKLTTMLARGVWRNLVPPEWTDARIFATDMDRVSMIDCADYIELRAERGHREATVRISGRQVAAKLNDKGEIVALSHDVVRDLIERLRDRLPKGWRLFGRPATPAIFKSRIRTRATLRHGEEK